MRIGILGGTFDPIHKAHMRAARCAQGYGLERIVFIPASHPPHKNHAEITDPFHRFAMVALACSPEGRMSLSPCEVSRAGPSYTVDTVRLFVAAGHEVVLVMGTDSLLELETWRECRTLLDLASVVAYPRRPFLRGDLPGKLPGWIREHMVESKGMLAGAGSVLCMEGDADDTSSTRIRELLRAGRPVDGLMPPGVEEYIRKHGLYAGHGEGARH